MSGVWARCCGSAHEEVLLRLDQCPSVMPPGPLFLVSVAGPGIGAWVPTELLVSSDMFIGDFAGYVFMVLLGCAPLSGVSPPLGVSLPLGASFQLRLVPGVSSGIRKTQKIRKRRNFVLLSTCTHTPP